MTWTFELGPKPPIGDIYCQAGELLLQVLFIYYLFIYFIYFIYLFIYLFIYFVCVCEDC